LGSGEIARGMGFGSSDLKRVSRFVKRAGLPVGGNWIYTVKNEEGGEGKTS